MAEAVIESPPAPAAAPTPSAVPRQTGTIRASDIAQPATPAAPPKPGSAKERLFESLRQKAKPADAPRPGAAEPPVPTQSPEPTSAEPGAEPPAGDPSSSPQQSPAGTPEPSDTKGKKLSPWKLVDQWKDRATRAETEIIELKKGIAPEQDVVKWREELKKTSERNKELEDEIRYVNYSKSTEFQEKYWKPYEDAFNRWMTDLGELQIQAEGQEPRALKANDIWTLMTMPLAEARATATQWVGDFADDVMSARKELRALFDKQSAALEEARKTGADRETKARTDYENAQSTLDKEIKTTWDTANANTLAHSTYGPYFKSVDGDEEGNNRLAKGFALADRAFSVNPKDPTLTPEKRAEAVKLHSALRNRAAATGRLIFWLERERAANAELKKELEKYKGSEPSTAPAAPRSNGEPSKPNAWSSVREALGKIAK